jgi:hypothetical protein
MPTRTATVKKKLTANGQALHRAMMRRKETGAGDKQPSEAEASLLEERKALKDEREKRKKQALLPRPTALDRLVRTHHAQAKEGKADKKAHDAAEVKKPKPKRSRAEKHAEQQAAIEAHRKGGGAAPKGAAAPKKPGK